MAKNEKIINDKAPRSVTDIGAFLNSDGTGLKFDIDPDSLILSSCRSDMPRT